MRGKRGLSQVVTTVIIIGLALIAIGILWAVISNVIENTVETIEVKSSDIRLEIRSVILGENDFFIKVWRGVGEGDLLGVKFIFYADGTSVPKERNKGMEQLSEFTFKDFNVNGVNDVEAISIAPIIKTSSGKKAVGNIADTWIKKGDIWSKASSTELARIIAGGTPGGGSDNGGSSGNGETPGGDCDPVCGDDYTCENNECVEIPEECAKACSDYVLVDDCNVDACGVKTCYWDERLDSCVSPYNADGVVDIGEECDDENTLADDGCSPSGMIELGYTCNDAGCIFCSTGSIDCGLYRDNLECGDDVCGFSFEEDFSCEWNFDDSLCSEGDKVICQSGSCFPDEIPCGSFQILGCGDGICPEQGTQCEAGVCAFGACCGDGDRTGSEECDDGNTVDGDGCSSICENEPKCKPLKSKPLDQIPCGEFYDRGCYGNYIDGPGTLCETGVCDGTSCVLPLAIPTGYNLVDDVQSADNLCNNIVDGDGFTGSYVCDESAMIQNCWGSFGEPNEWVSSGYLCRDDASYTDCLIGYLCELVP